MDNTMKDLVSGKIAIVTGGGSGIGACDARIFADEGAAGLLLPDIKLDAAQAVCDEIMAKHPQCKCVAVKTDVSSPEDVAHVFEVLEKEFGTLDILVNNAGVTNEIPFEDLTPEHWDRTYAINVKSAFLFCQKALPIMKAKGYGRIINMGSIAGQVGGLTSGADYATSKGAVLCLTKSVAKRGAAFGVTCNSVAPGQVNTAMARELHFVPENIPMKRVAEPEEIASVVLFLASDLAQYVTGNCVSVNGGMNML